MFIFCVRDFEDNNTQNDTFPSRSQPCCLEKSWYLEKIDFLCLFLWELCVWAHNKNIHSTGKSWGKISSSLLVLLTNNVREWEREGREGKKRNINDVSKKRRVINHAIATVWHDDHNKKSNFWHISGIITNISWHMKYV